jgi:hypothetical protein
MAEGWKKPRIWSRLFFWVFAGDLLGWALLDGLRAMDVGVLMAGGSRFTHPT